MTETETPTPTEAESGAKKITDPIHGSSYTFEPDGENLWVYTWLDHGGHLPEHFHPTQVEHWEVLEGAARVRLDGTWRDLIPADGPVEVTPNTRHELKNESGRTARLRCHVLPGGHLQDFLTESARAAQEGMFNSHNLPTSWRGATWLAAFALRFRDETVMTSPPPALQRIVLPLVARFAR